MNVPKLGMVIESFASAPRPRFGDLVFTGCYVGRTLTALRWQNIKTGEVITHEQFLNSRKAQNHKQ